MNELYEKLYGCLMGGAAGSAFGSNQKTDGRFGTDIVLQSLLLRKFLFKRKRLNSNDAAEAISQLKPEYMRGRELNIKKRLESGINAEEAGTFTEGFSSAFSALPGLIDCAAPELAYMIGYELSGVVSKGTERSMSALYSGITAFAMKPHTELEKVISSAEQQFELNITGGMELAHKRIDAGVPLQSSELVYAALVLTEQYSDNINEAIKAASALKQYNQTAAVLTGQLIGTLYGVRGLSAERTAQINSANAAFFHELYGTDKVTTIWDTADLLFYAMRVMCDSEQKSLNTLRKRLGDINGDKTWSSFHYQSLNDKHISESHIESLNN